MLQGLTQTHLLIDCFLFDLTIDMCVRHIWQTMKIWMRPNISMKSIISFENRIFELNSASRNSVSEIFFSRQYFLCRNYFGFPYPNHISFFPQNYLILPKQHHFSKTTQFPQNYSISPKLHHFTHLPFIIILKLIYFHN